MTYAEHFNSVQAFKDAVTATAGPVSQFMDAGIVSHKFCGYETEEQYKELAPTASEYSRPALIEDAARELADIKLAAAQSIADTLEFNDLVGDFDLGLLMDAAPDYRVAFEAAPTAAPRSINLVLNVAYAASVDASNGQYNGLAAAIVAEKLEQAGYGVELTAALFGNKCMESLKGAEKFDARLTICVKDAGQRVNLSATAYALSDPAFFRFWGFMGIYYAAVKVGNKAAAGYPEAYGLAAALLNDATAQAIAAMPANGRAVYHVRTCRNIQEVRQEVDRIIQLVNQAAEIAA